ncbi:MAG: histidyl-tRNA synthetase [Candidatus Saccharibacteria bacterium]|nr:histidyl-tRNA synthetase [Candidatus Saccharibacteria bacterium]
MSLSTQPYKGTRDFYPEDKRIQKYMFNKWRDVFELFGYEEYDAPVLEPTELYLAKGNEEIIQEQTYTFLDRGERSVTLRTEMTPSVSRLVAAKRQELAYPLRWYSIPNLWRYERPQKGRLREFWQLNVDIFGVAGIEADQEIIQVADATVLSFGAKRTMYSIKLNNRALMNYISNDFLGLDSVQSTTLIRLIDRMNKMKAPEFWGLVEAIFSPSQRDAKLTDKLKKILNAKTMKALPKEVAASEPAQKLGKLIELLHLQGISNAVYDPTLMRGFDYYTDIVFEVFDTDPENNRSMFGGGRYDGLIGQFGVEPVPSVGFAAGDVTFQNFLESHELLPVLASETDVYVILIGDVYERAIKPIQELREMGVKVAVDLTGRKMDKQIKTALKKNIPYALFIGEEELKKGQFKLKELAKNSEESLALARIVTVVKDYRRK